MERSDQAVAAPAGRQPLSRELIVVAALELIDRAGPESLSMRSLGKHLGYEAMALYRYVNGREDLLEAVVAHLMAGLRLPGPDDLGPHGGWQTYIQLFAHAVRDLALAHPKAFPLVATRHPAAPWLRPPLRSLDVVEHLLRSLLGHGFTDAQAVDAYRALTSFLLGYLLLESAIVANQAGPPGVELDEGEGPTGGQDREVELTDFPTLLRLRPLLAVDETEIEFEKGLESLLSRIEQLLTTC